jgi:ABC-type branched-subunit amino acid transport system ATPase component
MGYVPAAGGSVAWRAATSPARRRNAIARLGIGYVPEGRGIFPNLSVRENLVMTPRSPAPTAHRVDARARPRHVSAPAERAATAASSSRAASSRCWRSAAR